MSIESAEDSEFETISSILRIVCDDCGESNALRTVLCKACGAKLPQGESDEKSLSFLHAEGVDSSPVAHTNSHKLLRLRLALAAHRAGEATLELYHAVVEQVLLESRAIQDIMNVQALQDLEKRLPPEAIDVFRETLDNINAFCSACERMMAYDGNNADVAESGLDLAESTIVDMEATALEAAELERSSS